MQLLSRRAEAAIDRLTKLAYGDQALVNDALELYNNGQIPDLLAYIREKRQEPRRATSTHPPNTSTTFEQN
jgi:hypothetical protein